MKSCRFLRLVFLAFIGAPFLFAHSGGTDSQGGHNSSTGYHFHHGNPAHSHTDGLCPYIPPQPPQEVSSDTYPTLVINGYVGDIVSVEARDETDEWHTIVPSLALSPEAWIDQEPANRSKRFYRTKVIEWSFARFFFGGSLEPLDLSVKLIHGIKINGRVGQIIAIEAREEGGTDWQELERITLQNADFVWTHPEDRTKRYRTIVLYTPP